jgi:hypothetical protein
MPVIKYNEALVRIEEVGIGDIIVPANSVSIAYAASLEPSRILAANQNNNFRIGGPLAAKITMSFLACNTGSNNAANYLINTLTGNQGVYIGVADRVFYRCYCNSTSVDITPFAPITVSAEFVSYDMETNVPFGPDISYQDDLNGYLAHGHNTIISNGTALSDGNYGAISYRVNCGRTPSFTLGQTEAQTENIFLDSVEKEVSIKATNIGNFIDYSGYGDTITIDVKDDSGTSIFTPPLSMSANSRIVSQNLSITEGEILAGDISLREVIL